MQMEHAAEDGSRQLNLSLYRYAKCSCVELAGRPLSPVTLESGVFVIDHAFQ
jgi:hypothetical protein